MTIESFKTTVLRASQGHFLTQSADVDIKERIVASVIALGKNDSEANYKEITETEAEEIRQAQKNTDNDD